MALTLGNWGLVAFIFLCLICGGGIGSWMTGNKKHWLYWGISGVIVAIFIIGGFHLYNTSTASGIRNYKDWQSEISNGIEREITITAEDGREIFHYEGKVDIESNHEDNYIKFESEDGKRYIIYYGITDTILIVEK